MRKVSFKRFVFITLAVLVLYVAVSVIAANHANAQQSEEDKAHYFKYEYAIINGTCTLVENRESFDGRHIRYVVETFPYAVCELARSYNE